MTVPTTPVATETTTSLPSQPDHPPSNTDKSTTEALVKHSSHHESMDTDPSPPPTSAAIKLPVEQNAVPNSQDVVQPKICPDQKGMPKEDDEKPGLSGLNYHTSSSSSVAPSAPFIPFTGGGQRLGGLSGGALGRTLSSSSSSSLTAAVESPKAKKAKSSHSCGTKVSYIFVCNMGSRGKCRYFTIGLLNRYFNPREKKSDKISFADLIDCSTSRNVIFRLLVHENMVLR